LSSRAHASRTAARPLPQRAATFASGTMHTYLVKAAAFQAQTRNLVVALRQAFHQVETDFICNTTSVTTSVTPHL
jgi:hypothetical protein